MKPELAKVGPAWDGGNIETWPGVGGVPGQTNHLAQNKNPFLPDPENTSLVGGRKSRRHARKSRRHVRKSRRHVRKSRRHARKSRRHVRKSRRHVRKSRRHVRKSRRHTKRKFRGGSKHGKTLFPQSLVNLGRNMQYNAESTWSSFTGAQQPVNPDPLVQPIGI